MSHMATTSFPHALVIGGGLGGLALAQALRKLNVSFEVFERDSAPNSRPQGWALSLHWILNDLISNLPSDMPPIETVSHFHAHNISAQFKLWDASGKQLMEIHDTPEQRLIRADRMDLRKWLYTNLDVSWGKKFERYEETPDGVLAIFEDGSSARGDVLLHSVRHQLLPHALLLTIGLGSISGETVLTRSQYNQQMALGRSAFVTISAAKSRIFQGLKSISADEESAVYYWVYSWLDAAATEEPHWTMEASQQEQYDFVLEHTKDFDPKFTEVIKLTRVEEIMLPPLVLQDILPEQQPHGRVTLLGDAAHAMSPFRGEGGNHALQDGLNIARALANVATGAVEDRLKTYEEMILRTREAVEKAREATIQAPEKATTTWESVPAKRGEDVE